MSVLLLLKIQKLSGIESKFKEKRFPTKEELDSVSTEHPIILTRTCKSYFCG
ncbi:hypothetical protein [Oceanobacillus kimchii]|uniref:hypothetical protein n=1 Tax=Oceanobacillus kimchii TaxID=746691 RepID=UPI003B028DC0